MALNPMIPLQAQGFQMPDQANALAKFLMMRGQIDEQQMRQVQLQQIQQAMQDQARQRAEVEKRRALAGQFQIPGAPAQPKPSYMDNRDVGQPGEASLAAKPPSFDFEGYAGALAGSGDPMGALQLRQLLQKEDKETVVAPGSTVLRNGVPTYTAPATPKEVSQPSAVQEYQFAVGQGYKGTFDQWKKDNARAGASTTKVDVSTGQKGLDNTLKLRGDFRSEPIYKAHQETQSAHAQIKQALKQASPAGDLAGATKIMKILDPGSVVRESELGMAMAASGLMDRIQNYAQNVLKGTKLTPTQRKDFNDLADALYAESMKLYNAKRSEYQGIAERNQLNVQDVLGPESKSTGGEWGIVR